MNTLQKMIINIVGESKIFKGGRGAPTTLCPRDYCGLHVELLNVLQQKFECWKQTTLLDYDDGDVETSEAYVFLVHDEGKFVGAFQLEQDVIKFICYDAVCDEDVHKEMRESTCSWVKVLDYVKV